MSERIDAFVVAVPGLESLVLAEVQKLGVRPARVVRGGVECTVTWPQLWALNLRCRVATRVLVRLRRFKADGFHSLEKGIGAIPWPSWLSADAGVQVSVTADAGSKLYHSGAVEERVLAVLDRPEGEQRVFVRVLNDVVTVSLDASGDSLHRRGYRGAAGKAPLRETLAAAVVLGSGWDAKSPLIDPFCGSGTIAIEAALLARRMAPGRHRPFAFQQWPSFDAVAWGRLLGGADGDVVTKCPPIMASDRDAGAVAAAVANAAAAGVAENIEVAQRSVSDLTLPAGRPGWIVSNPPYGVRVGATSGGAGASRGSGAGGASARSDGDLRNLYDRFGAVLREGAGGWHVAVLASADTPVARMHLPLRPELTTSNGGIDVALHTGVVPAAPAVAGA